MLTYTEDLIHSLLEKDGSKCIGPLPYFINRSSEVRFLCVCGKEGVRRAEQLYKKGGVCAECVQAKRIAKIKETNLERYGMAYPMQRTEVKEKRKQNYLDSIGVEAAMKLESVRQVLRDKALERWRVYREGKEGLEIGIGSTTIDI